MEPLTRWRASLWVWGFCLLVSAACGGKLTNAGSEPTATVAPTTSPTGSPVVTASPANTPSRQPLQWRRASGSLTLKVTVTPGTPRVGEKVTLEAVADDNQGGLLAINMCVDEECGLSHTHCLGRFDPSQSPTPSPVPTPTAERRSQTHTFTAAGTHRLHVTATSSCGYLGNREIEIRESLMVV